MFPYDHTIQPPAPSLSVLVSNSKGNAPLSTRVTVDSGSSITALPLDALRALKTPAFDYLVVSGYENKETRMRTFIVAVEVAGHRLWPLEVVGLDRSDGILGRDVLNRFIVTLDGPALTFDMHLPTEDEP